MAEADLVIDERFTVPGWELYVTTSRSGGAGGQHVNKTSSRVMLHWMAANTTAFDEASKRRVLRALSNRLNKEGVIQVVSDGDRSQMRNREAARERLAQWIRAALVRRKTRRPTRPTKGSKLRRLDGKSQRSQIKKLRGKPRLDD